MNIVKLLLVLFLFSCTNHVKINNEIIQHLYEKNHIDVENWKIVDFKKLESSVVTYLPDYNNCKELYIQYDIVLEEDCFENNNLKYTLEKNSVIKAIKDFLTVKTIQSKLYHRNECLSDSWLNNLVENEKLKIENKIGEKFCFEKKSFFSSDCAVEKIFTKENAKDEINQLLKKINIEKSFMIKHTKGERFFQKERVVICEDSNKKIIFP